MVKTKKVVATLVLAASLCMGEAFAQDKLYANEFPLADVTLLEGPFQHARDLNIKVLLEYDVDRLMAGYRKEAGLPEKAKSYPNWDGLDGHIGGHYLSALAMNYAATGNKACGERMDYVLAELKACLDANNARNQPWAKGYIGAIPNSEKIWSTFLQGNFSAFRNAWVPFYNVHKMYAGLRDAWLYTGSADAKQMFLQFCDWGINIVADLDEKQMQSILDTEQGGMNEIFADAFEMTGEKKYLAAAKKYSHHMLLDAMAAKVDNLDNKHANTQVPKAIGFQRIGELANDSAYKIAGQFFWQTVTQTRSLAFGGNSRREFFPGVTASKDFVNDVEGPESCNSYNMLKLTEDLFRLNPLAQYADYYERALYNHILSTQHPQHGGYVYFTPARPQHYRVYSAPNEGMWCCVGSGMENHGKYSQFIYTHQNNALYVNLFVASTLNWKEKKISLKQETKFPEAEQTKITITSGNANFPMMIRYPSWVQAKALKITVNGKALVFKGQPSSYISIQRLWKKGDILNITLPMHNSIEKMPNVANYIAIMHGPILLAAKSGTGDLKGLIADDSRWGHIAGGKKIAINEAPIFIEDTLASIAANLKPVPGQPLHFTVSQTRMLNAKPFVFEPFYKIHDARYMMYWMALSNAGYKNYLDSIALIEKRKLEVEKRTIDFVAPGEQQPEADHFITSLNSGTGNTQDIFYRDARNEGFFSYQLTTKKQTGLSLLIKYWGAEWGSRKFDIFIDDKKLVTEDNTGKWNQSAFQEVAYAIPDELVNGKETVRIMFKALPGSAAGGVYYIRLLK